MPDRTWRAVLRSEGTWLTVWWVLFVFLLVAILFKLLVFGILAALLLIWLLIAGWRIGEQCL